MSTRNASGMLTVGQKRKKSGVYAACMYTFHFSDNFSLFLLDDSVEMRRAA